MPDQDVPLYRLNVQDVANRLGVHPNTVKRIPPADLPYLVVSRRGDRHYCMADLRRYIATRLAGGAS